MVMLLNCSQHSSSRRSGASEMDACHVRGSLLEKKSPEQEKCINPTLVQSNDHHCAPTSVHTDKSPAAGAEVCKKSICFGLDFTF